jgi:hypothetical protein
MEEIVALREYYLRRGEQEGRLAKNARSRVAANIHRQLQKLHEMMFHDINF